MKNDRRNKRTDRKKHIAKLGKKLSLLKSPIVANVIIELFLKAFTEQLLTTLWVIYFNHQ